MLKITRGQCDSASRNVELLKGKVTHAKKKKKDNCNIVAIDWGWGWDWLRERWVSWRWHNWMDEKS